MKKLILIALFALPNASYGMSGVLKKFKAAYPEATRLAEMKCTLCHSNDQGDLNPYGLDLQKTNTNFVAVENLDSDGDGFSNITEIKANTPPGSSEFHPLNADEFNEAIEAYLFQE